MYWEGRRIGYFGKKSRLWGRVHHKPHNAPSGLWCQRRCRYSRFVRWGKDKYLLGRFSLQNKRCRMFRSAGCWFEGRRILRCKKFSPQYRCRSRWYRCEGWRKMYCIFRSVGCWFEGQRSRCCIVLWEERRDRNLLDKFFRVGTLCCIDRSWSCLVGYPRKRCYIRRLGDCRHKSPFGKSGLWGKNCCKIHNVRCPFGGRCKLVRSGVWGGSRWVGMSPRCSFR